MSNYVLYNRRNFHLHLLRRFKDIAVFIAGFSLLHPVYIATVWYRKTATVSIGFCSILLDFKFEEYIVFSKLTF